MKNTPSKKGPLKGVSPPTKIRPPRIYRTKTGRPYIKHKGKKVYLNFGKKTNDMSNISILKLFLKYLKTKKRDVKNKPTKAQVIYPDTDRIELENRQRVDSQVRNYLRDKYEKINEMDKEEEKKRKEAKELADERRRVAEAKQRQDMADSVERAADINRAIERERKLQAELKADRAISQTILRLLTASNDRMANLITEGKIVARDVAADVKNIEREAKRGDNFVVEDITRADDLEKKKVAAENELKKIQAELKKSEEELKKSMAEVKRSEKEIEKNKEDAAKAKEEAKIAREEAKKSEEKTKKADEKTAQATRNMVIEAMFSAPISVNDDYKITPTRLITALKDLGYEIKEIKNKNNQLNAKDTIKDFLRVNPEKFDLGGSADDGWNNLLTQLTDELTAAAVAEEVKQQAEEEKRKAEEAKQMGEEKTIDDSKQKTIDDSKQEAGEVAGENDEEVEEPGAEQEGTGVRGACIKIIGKLKVKDIKKFLKKTHTDTYRKKYRHKGKLLKFNYIEALILAMKDEKIRSAVCSKLETERLKPNQIGGGDDPQKGLTTTQIDGLMSDEKRYLGTVASDEIKTLKPKGAKYAFIMNTDKASKPGQHWIAVYISGKDDKTVEVYDPLGTYEPTKEFLEQIKTLVDKMKLDHYLLLKVNKIKNQSDTSDTCGWFAVKFLKERFLGNRFKFSTGFTQLKEDEIQRYKKQNGYGFDTYI